MWSVSDSKQASNLESSMKSDDHVSVQALRCVNRRLYGENHPTLDPNSLSFSLTHSIPVSYQSGYRMKY